MLAGISSAATALARSASDSPGATARDESLDVVVTTLSSDSHTWNLVFLQLLIEELGHRVVNLGPCVPDELIMRTCRERNVDLLVVSSVNGHGALDGERLIRKLRATREGAALPAVIGGKLGVAGLDSGGMRDRLLAAGYNAVFEDRAPIVGFRSLLGRISAGAKQ
jgi:methylaspartate mutase sigma subunit